MNQDFESRRASRAHGLIEVALQLLASVPRYIWDHSSLPVPIEDIADSHLGLHVKDVEPEEMCTAPGLPASAAGTQISGLLMPEKKQIWVNAEESRRWPLRRRYTIAHEIAHWTLHINGHASLVECRAEQIGHPRPDKVVRENDKEWEANTFAGGLLIPPPLLRREWKGDPASCRKVADRFQVSETALSYQGHRRKDFGRALDLRRHQTDGKLELGRAFDLYRHESPPPGPDL